jgi:hypothetical protein
VGEIVESGELIVVKARIFTLVQHAESFHVSAMVRAFFACVVGDQTEATAKVKLHATIAANHFPEGVRTARTLARAMELKSKAISRKDASEAFDSCQKEFFGL